MQRSFHLLNFTLYLIAISEISETSENLLKSKVFHSPPFYISPGSVINKYYYAIDFPSGHIAIKSFNSEVVDDRGVPVPLYEAYLHHWGAARYFLNDSDPAHPMAILAGNSGVCSELPQHYGLGSETHRTRTWVPDPYAVEAGNPKQIPGGFTEKWLLNIHAIDTRGVADRWGCVECRCKLYNATQIPPNYVGGLLCCGDQTQCKLREGFSGAGRRRRLYLRYTVEWMEWSDWILPVRIYVFDVTWRNPNSSSCLIEYDIERCESDGLNAGSCADTRQTSVLMPRGGELVYGVAHQHAGGLGSTLYSQNGGVLCSSLPLYGNGTEAGNEAGYVVGMSTCYPPRGSARIRDG